MRPLIAGAAFALALAAPAMAGPPDWRPVNAATGQIADTQGLEALAEDFPDSGLVRLRLLQAQLGAGDVDAVLESLAWLKERGYVFSAGAQAQLPELIGAQHAAAARALLLVQAEPIEASEIVAEVPAGAGLIESVALLGADRIVAVTSVTRKEVWFRSDAGNWSAIAPPNADDLSGIIYDPARMKVWIASANLDESPDDKTRSNGLVGLQLDARTMAFAAAPEGVALSDLAVGQGGAVFASDPIGGGIYTIAAGAATIETLMAPGTFRSPQGLAASTDGQRLYVSDYRYGLAIVDLGSGTVSRLRSEVPVLLDGVDGLWLHEGELIAVQNGTSPMRISAMRLSPDGTRIIGHRMLEQAHSQWTEPLGGNIVHGDLIYVATGQWDRYEEGALREGVEAIPTQIRRLPLGLRAD